MVRLMVDAPAAGSDESAVDAFLQGGESLRHAPGPYFGSYGGRWMPESLIAALDELEDTFEKAKADPEFTAQIAELNKNYSGRPSLLTEAKRFAEHAGGVRIFLKREDLNHTGSHKINNVLGQALLAKRMGKTRVIAETGAGQHGVASATAAALMGLECVVYMGAEDCRRQALNVARMELLGATVIPVTNGSQTLKDAINEALRDWVANVDNTHYLLGTAAGAHPFPAMVRYFHEVIGEEARAQILEQTGRLPDAVCACIGGGSNAIGIFHGFLDDPSVKIYGFEAGGDGVETGRHAATITLGKPGVLHGARSYLMQDDDGQTIESHSISAGLDYPGVGPEHSYLADIGRVSYEPITDSEAMDAFRLLCRTEGIIPAIESAHALAGAIKVGQRLAAEAGRGAVREDRAREPLRPRRQGRGHRRGMVRPAGQGFTRARDRQRGGAAVSTVQDPGTAQAASKSAAAIDRAKAQGRAALIGYLPAGYPSVEETIAAGIALAENGADLIEIGIPYSDPVMDGLVIQAATTEALAKGFHVKQVFDVVRGITSKTDAAVLVMTYWNPVVRMGVDEFSRQLAEAGGAGLITPDLIPDEAVGMDGSLGQVRPGPGVPGGAVVLAGADEAHR